MMRIPLNKQAKLDLRLFILQGLIWELSRSMKRLGIAAKQANESFTAMSVELKNLKLNEHGECQ